jgi:glyoxylase-like metal-dependent hydrolase (beta-lactamase superfamily II)
VTASHHHADHAGGVRPFAALGAPVIIGADAVPLFTRALSDRGSRLLPDRLDGTNQPATIRTVPSSGRITLTDAVRPVVVLPERTSHATTTILVYVPDEGILFVNGDTYTPGGPAGPGGDLARADDPNQRPPGEMDRGRAWNGRALRAIPHRDRPAAAVPGAARGATSAQWGVNVHAKIFTRPLVGRIIGVAWGYADTAQLGRRGHWGPWGP